MGYKNFREVYHKLAIVLDNGYCHDTLCMSDKTKPEQYKMGLEVYSRNS